MVGKIPYYTKEWATRIPIKMVANFVASEG